MSPENAGVEWLTEEQAEWMQIVSRIGAGMSAGPIQITDVTNKIVESTPEGTSNEDIEALARKLFSKEFKEDND